MYFKMKTGPPPSRGRLLQTFLSREQNDRPRAWGRMLTSDMPVVKAAGRSLSYEWIEGDGRSRPTLVFLHEGLGSIRQWRDFPVQVVAATGCRALVYDRYGYGQSDILEEARRPVRFMHDEALSLLPELRRALHIDDAILVGHS